MFTIAGWWVFVVASLVMLVRRHPRDVHAWHILLLGAFLPFVPPGVAAVHELGHVIGAWVTGSPVLLVKVGPIVLRRRATGFRLEWRSDLRLNRPLTVAVSGPGNQRLRMSLGIAAGPLASWLLAVGGGIAMLGVPPFTPTWILAGTLVWFSALGALLNAAPRHSAYSTTDGGRIRMLLRNDAEGRRWCAQSVLEGALFAGVRPRDWDSATLEAALAPSDVTSDAVAAATLGYLHAIDSGDIEEAAGWINRAVVGSGSWPRVLQAEILLEAAYFHALHGDGAGPAREYLDKAGPGLTSEACTRLRAEAAVLMAEGDLAGGRGRITAAQHQLGQVVERGRVPMEGDLLQALARCLAMACSPTAAAPAETPPES